MGLCNCPDIFRERMSTMIEDLELCRTYIHDLFVLSKGSWEQHVHNLETILHRHQEQGLKVNSNTSAFGAHEVE
jgi:hypothetical protein